MTQLNFPNNPDLLDSVFNFIPSGLILVEIDANAGSREQRMLRPNEKAQEILGLDPSLLPACMDFQFPHYLSPLIRILNTSNCDVQRGELALHLPTREEESLLGYNLKYMPGENGKNLMLFIFSDITQVRKDQLAVEKIRDELHQSKKLASLGTLVAGVAHELNNPLAGISMSASLLRMNLDRLKQMLPASASATTASSPDDAGLVDEVCRSVERSLLELDKIDRAGGKAANLVGDLLSYARPSRMTLQPMPLYPLIRDMIQAIREHPGFSRMDLHIEGETDDWVACDQGKLEQVFYNLLKNASDATHAEGRVRLFFDRTQDDMRRDFVCIHVEDNGPGIEKTILNRIFDPFFTTKGNSGVGLGLSISYRIIEQHGGRLSVEASSVLNAPASASAGINAATPATPSAGTIDFASSSDDETPYGGAHYVISLPIYPVDDVEQTVSTDSARALP